MSYWQYLSETAILITLEEMHQSISLLKDAVQIWSLLLRTIKTKSCSSSSCWQLYTLKLVTDGYESDIKRVA